MFNTFLKALAKVIKSYCEDDKLNPAHKLVLVSTLFLTSPSDAIPFCVNLNTSNVFSILEHARVEIIKLFPIDVKGRICGCGNSK